MTRALIVLSAASILCLASCRDPERDGFVQLPCSDAGECFDARVEPDAALDVMQDAMPDAIPDAMDAMSDVMPTVHDVMPTIHDAAPDAIPDAVPDSLPDAPSDATPDAMPDAGPDAPDAADGPRDMAPAADMGPPRDPVESCHEINSVECFGHPDCPEAERCENVGTDRVIVPCCVPGRRGDIQPGGSCDEVDGQIECRSGVCIEDVGGDAVCSGPCEDADDCPAALPRCVAFPFGGTDFLWCFPE